MEQQELVSIIMPAYNAASTIACAIDSVLSQTYQQWELVVINDASSDDTAEIASAYAARDSRIRVLCNEQNMGVSETRRRGMQAAHGRWLALLDSDDAWQPDKLEKQMRIAGEGRAQLVFTGSSYMDSHGNPREWVFHVPETITYRKLLKQNVISNSSVLIRKDWYERSILNADDIHEDFVCWLRFLREGGIACGIDEPLLIYRLSPGSKSGNKLRSARMAWRSYRLIGLSLPEAAYYMSWYSVTGVLKHRHLRMPKEEQR